MVYGFPHIQRRYLKRNLRRKGVLYMASSWTTHQMKIFQRLQRGEAEGRMATNWHDDGNWVGNTMSNVWLIDNPATKKRETSRKIYQKACTLSDSENSRSFTYAHAVFTKKSKLKRYRIVEFDRKGRWWREGYVFGDLLYSGLYDVRQYWQHGGIRGEAFSRLRCLAIAPTPLAALQSSNECLTVR